MILHDRALRLQLWSWLALLPQSCQIMLILSEILDRIYLCRSAGVSPAALLYVYPPMPQNRKPQTENCKPQPVCHALRAGHASPEWERPPCRESAAVCRRTECHRRILVCPFLMCKMAF